MAARRTITNPSAVLSAPISRNICRSRTRPPEAFVPPADMKADDLVESATRRR